MTISCQPFIINPKVIWGQEGQHIRLSPGICYNESVFRFSFSVTHFLIIDFFQFLYYFWKLCQYNQLFEKKKRKEQNSRQKTSILAGFSRDISWPLAFSMPLLSDPSKSPSNPPILAVSLQYPSPALKPHPTSDAHSARCSGQCQTVQCILEWHNSRACLPSSGTIPVKECRQNFII